MLPTLQTYNFVERQIGKLLTQMFDPDLYKKIYFRIVVRSNMVVLVSNHHFLNNLLNKYTSTLPIQFNISFKTQGDQHFKDLLVLH